MARAANSASEVYDVIVLGAGVIGATLAWKLAADGYRVCVCDDAPEPPQPFRTGHLSQQAAELYRELGIFGKLRPLLSPLDYTAHFRNGRLNEITSNEDYAISYDRLAATLRHGLENVATLCWDPVVRASPKGRVKSIRLQSGRVICGWILAVADPTNRIREIFPELEEERIWEDHSRSFSWNMELAEPRRMSHPAMVFQTSHTRHAYEHLRIFRGGGQLRGNLFTFWSAGDERGRKFATGEAKPVLARTVEGLFEYLGDFRLTSGVEEAMVSLTRVRGGAEAGIALVGDACGQVAPCFEMGLCKGLHDVKVLASLTPGWLRERQNTSEVLASYYAHPVKRAIDEEAFSKCIYARKKATDRSPEWLARRLRADLPEWLETACLRGVEGGRWTMDNVGLPAWRKGLRFVRNYRESRAQGVAGSGRVLAPSHDDLARADGLDNLVS